MSKAVLTIASKNYGSWSLRGWLLCKMAGIDFEEQHIGTDDPSMRAELLLLSPSFLVPCLEHGEVKVWQLPNTCMSFIPRRVCCLPTARSAPIAARFAGRCIPASAIYDRRCR